MRHIFTHPTHIVYTPCFSLQSKIMGAAFQRKANLEVERGAD